MRIFAPVIALALLYAHPSHAAFEAEYRRALAAASAAADPTEARAWALVRYVDAAGPQPAAKATREIRSRIVELIAVDFVATARGLLASKLEAQRLIALTNSLRPEHQNALRAYWGWIAQASKNNKLTPPRSTPYPPQLPPPGYGFGRRPAASAPTAPQNPAPEPIAAPPPAVATAPASAPEPPSGLATFPPGCVEDVCMQEVAAAAKAPDPTAAREAALKKYLDRFFDPPDRDLPIIRTVISNVMKIDFPAAAKCCVGPRMLREKFTVVLDGLTPMERTAFLTYCRFLADDYRATAGIPGAQHLPYPASIPPNGYGLGRPYPAPTPVVVAKSEFQIEQEKRDAKREQALRHASAMGWPPDGALVTRDGSCVGTSKMLWSYNEWTGTFSAWSRTGSDANPNGRAYRICDRGPYQMCPTCHGVNSSTRRNVLVSDTAFHQTNFNVYESNPNVGRQVEDYDLCPQCQGNGYVRK